MPNDRRLTREQVASTVDAGLQFLATQKTIMKCAQIGSSVYLASPRDVDFIVLVEPAPEGQAIDAVSAFCDPLTSQGWEYCGEYTETLNGWNAIRKDDLNLIVSADPQQFEAYRAAMEVCKALGLVDKADRRLVCRIIRDGLSEDAARQLAESKGETSDKGALLNFTPELFHG